MPTTKTTSPIDARRGVDIDVAEPQSARPLDSSDGPGAPSLEDALAALDGILAELEAGEIPLDEAIGLYERGVRLAKQVDGQLAAAELRVRQIDGKEPGE